MFCAILFFVPLIGLGTKLECTQRNIFATRNLQIGTNVTNFGTKGPFCSKLEQKVPFHASVKEHLVPLFNF